MVASQVHLVRHGEVFNPDGILYGRLPGFGLSKLGHRMARAAADDLVARERPVTALRVSPLQRTRESAAPIAAAFALDPAVEERIIEPTNHFEGTVMSRALKNPVNWPFVVNPLRPSWGEPYSRISARMLAAIDDAFDSVESGDVVLVSHQLPIWVAHLTVFGERFPHDPRKRRCALSSITTFERTTEPARPRPARARRDARDSGRADRPHRGGRLRRARVRARCRRHRRGSRMTAAPRRRAPRRLRLALPAVAAAAALFLAGCTANDNLAQQYRSGSGQNYIAGDGSVSEYASGNRGEPVNFSGKLTDGSNVSSKDYAGKVLVVNFWYAGCPPCRVEAPDLEALSQKYASEGVGFLGVNLYDTASTAESFEKDKGVTYPSVLDRDTGSVLLAFSKTVPPKATPTTLVIDKEGRVAARILGAVPDRSILDTLISDAVAEH